MYALDAPAKGTAMTIDDLAHMPLAQLQKAFSQGTITPLEVMEITLAQIHAVNDDINALYGVMTEDALELARASSKRYAQGMALSPFDGVPVTIKDSVNATGTVWHHGSAVHGNGVLAKSDSPPVKRLKQAGAIVLGKGIMPDFGLSASGVSGSHGIVRNPWGLDWNTGGSSAGGGASIAAGIGMMSVGSDIAGSVRLPASHCGLAALKPTQGVIPHAPASTVRSAGPMVRHAADLHAWATLLSGPDILDRFSMPYAHANDATPSVGATSDFGFGPKTEPEIQACFNRVKGALTKLVGHVEDIDKKADFDAYLPIDQSLKIKGWQEYSAAADGLKSKVPDQLLHWFDEAKYWSALDVQNINDGLERAINYSVYLMDEIDILLTPVMPIVNFAAEERGIDPQMPLRHTTFTALFNQAGNPAVSICGGFDARGLPIGMQLVGKRLDDARLIELAAKLEAELNLFGPQGAQWPTTPKS